MATASCASITCLVSGDGQVRLERRQPVNSNRYSSVGDLRLSRSQIERRVRFPRFYDTDNIDIQSHHYTTAITDNRRASKQYWLNHISTRMLADAQRDGSPAEYRWRPLRKFRNFIPCTMPQSLTDSAAGVSCSNAANIEERKTWTQSEFCTWRNSVRGQEPMKVYIHIA